MNDTEANHSGLNYAHGNGPLSKQRDHVAAYLLSNNGLSERQHSLDFTDMDDDMEL